MIPRSREQGPERISQCERAKKIILWICEVHILAILGKWDGRARQMLDPRSCDRRSNITGLDRTHGCDRKSGTDHVLDAVL